MNSQSLFRRTSGFVWILILCASPVAFAAKAKRPVAPQAKVSAKTKTPKRTVRKVNQPASPATNDTTTVATPAPAPAGGELLSENRGQADAAGADIVAWSKIAKSENQNDFQQFIDAYPQSPYAESARVRLRALQAGELTAAQAALVNAVKPTVETIAHEAAVDTARDVARTEVEKALAAETPDALFAKLRKVPAFRDLLTHVNESQEKLERDVNNACVSAGTQPQYCVRSSFALLVAFPQSQYASFAYRNAHRHIISLVWESFQSALKTYYSGSPSAANLDKLVAAGELFMQFSPEYPYVIAQLALASQSATQAEISREAERTKRYAETALRVFAPTKSSTREMEQAQWDQFRENIQATSNQYLGYYYLHSTPKDTVKALTYLNLSIAVKSRNGNVGWKDPNNYWLRATVYNESYVEYGKRYSALSDAAKQGEAGKALLQKIHQAIDKLIPEYARVVAVATRAPDLPLANAARETGAALWKFRHGADLAGFEALIQRYRQNPAAE